MAYSKMKRRIKKRVNKLIERFDLKIIDSPGFKAMGDVGEINHIIDVGVAYGTPDLYERFPDAFLDLFEPHPDHIDLLKSSILAKRDGRLHEFALGNSIGNADLFLSGPTGSSLVKNNTLNYNGMRNVNVPVKRLDGVLSTEDIKRPCLLKVDVEGFDYKVLQGAQRLLNSIDCIVSEVRFHNFDEYEPGDLISYLKGHGFKLKEILEVHVDRGKILCADFVFVQK